MSYEVRINPRHPGVMALGAYPVQEPPMVLTKEWKPVVELTQELKTLAKNIKEWPAIAEVREAGGKAEKPEKASHESGHRGR